MILRTRALHGFRTDSVRWIAAVLALLTPITPSDVCAQTAQQSTVRFQNVRIFDGKEDALSTPSNVLIRGNKIEKISTSSIRPRK